MKCGYEAVHLSKQPINSNNTSLYQKFTADKAISLRGDDNYIIEQLDDTKLVKNLCSQKNLDHPYLVIHNNIIIALEVAIMPSQAIETIQQGNVLNDYDSVSITNINVDLGKQAIGEEPF